MIELNNGQRRAGLRWGCSHSCFLATSGLMASLQLIGSSCCGAIDMNLTKFHRHDNMATHMGVPATPFHKLYEPQVKQMLRLFGEYIKDLHRLKTSAVPVAQGLPDVSQLTIHITPNGFPLLPKMDGSTPRKIDLESLLRNYLNIHYSM